MYSQQVQKIDDVPEVPKSKPRRLINIFDIDGCICKSLFPNVEDKKQSAAEIEELVSGVNNKKENKLYQGFIDYYYDVLDLCLYNFFVTGRKISHFYRLTERQLSALPSGSFMVKYYPEHLEHIKSDYHGWKLNTIGALIHSFSQKYDSNTPIVFRIFDDDKSYFEDLHEFELPESFFTTYHIYEPEHWSNIQNHIFGRHYKFGYEEVFLE
jgi:hypothetical protein